MGRKGAKWGHGFRPRNMAAALMKAHGNRHYAAKLLGQKTPAKRSPIKATMARRRKTVRTFKNRSKYTAAKRS
jgi:hypothetical protein